MRRLLAILLALIAVAPASSVLGAGTALAAASGPALVPGALDGSLRVRAGSLDASDRWIVVLRSGSRLDVAGARAKGLGIRQDRVFNGSIRGYSARLANAQLALLRADPNVEAVIPDDILSVQAQRIPTGVSRVFGTASPIARISGQDHRVNADVAIVDTGIDPHHVDLNVVGGINCATSDPTAWSDPNGHGTHVAGTVGALDNGYGVVGVAPGVRLWSVRVLDPMGNGLLSWYVCGLDWVAAQKDPNDATRPLFEAVNMSVAKPGHDDGNCGYTVIDVMHRAICRVVAAGIPVVAAAGNYSGNAASWIPAAYSQVITVSALADTDGKPGGLGGRACYSWNSYDRDDTFADFSNYGSVIDLIAPGKCILSTLPGNRYGVLSGTSMATPLVTGAVALYKSTRPLATPYQVKRALQLMGNLNWNTATDPDPWHEPLLDVSWIVDAGDFAVRYVNGPVTSGGKGGTFTVPLAAVRAEDFTLPLDFSAQATAPVTAALSVTHLEPTADRNLSATVTVPSGTPSGIYPVTVTATDGSRERSTTIDVVVDATPPVASPPVLGIASSSTLGLTTAPGFGRWPAATDAFGSLQSYQTQWSVDGGAWASTVSSLPSVTLLGRTFAIGHRYAMRVRARDNGGNWSAWASSATIKPVVVQETLGSLVWTGRWSRVFSSTASGGAVRYTTGAGAAVSLVFRGTGFAIVTPRSPTRGKFQVWVDG
ncbi:MAG TPA: S8 family serine peptidase, partial [Candidatus Limnocylindrales bacterium]